MTNASYVAVSNNLDESDKLNMSLLYVKKVTPMLLTLNTLPTLSMQKGGILDGIMDGLRKWYDAPQKIATKTKRHIYETVPPTDYMGEMYGTVLKNFVTGKKRGTVKSIANAARRRDTANENMDKLYEDNYALELKENRFLDKTMAKHGVFSDIYKQKADSIRTNHAALRDSPKNFAITEEYKKAGRAMDVVNDDYPTLDEDAWRKYLGIPLIRKNSIRPSKYRPSVGDRDKDTYYTSDNLRNMRGGLVIRYGRDGDNTDAKFPVYTDNDVAGVRATELANYKVDKGSDARGNYLSISDKYDFGHGADIAGKPFNWYEKVYYNKNLLKELDSLNTHSENRVKDFNAAIDRNERSRIPLRLTTNIDAPALGQGKPKHVRKESSLRRGGLIY